MVRQTYFEYQKYQDLTIWIQGTLLEELKKFLHDFERTY